MKHFSYGVGETNQTENVFFMQKKEHINFPFIVFILIPFNQLGLVESALG